MAGLLCGKQLVVFIDRLLKIKKEDSLTDDEVRRIRARFTEIEIELFDDAWEKRESKRGFRQPELGMLSDKEIRKTEQYFPFREAMRKKRKRRQDERERREQSNAV